VYVTIPTTAGSTIDNSTSWDNPPVLSLAPTPIGEVNPSLTSYAPNDPGGQLAELSSTMNWSAADSAPCQALNEILWKDAKGTDAILPELRVSKIAAPGGGQTVQPGDGDD